MTPLKGMVGLALGALLLGLIGCDDAPTAAVRCALLGETVGVDQVVIDREAGLRCVCQADGTGRCEPLGDGGAADPDVGAGDATAPADRGAPPDGAVAEDAGPIPDEGLAADAGLEPDAAPVDAAIPDMAPPIDMAVPAVCAPGAPVCVGGDRFTCGPDGAPGAADPCPADAVCVDGACVPGQADVLLLIETSISMDDPVVDGVAEAWPVCEDLATPFTRLGRVKQALGGLFDGPDLAGARVGLVRMPQLLQRTFSCPDGYYRPRRAWPSASVEPQAYGDADYADVRPNSLLVPLPIDGVTPVEALQAWVDFDEVLAPDRSGHLNPELRATGNSAFGRALFIAGSYLEREVLKEGAGCAADADCGSPHFRCEGGTCRDPLGACRTRAVVVFADTGETVDWDPTMSYFAPEVQAKRFRFGLGCGVDADCQAGAVCTAGRCVTGRCASDPRLPCTEPDQCPLRGRCDVDDLPFYAETAWALRHAGGGVARVSVHVIDGSGADLGASTAFWGGGLHVRLPGYDVGAIMGAFAEVFTAIRAETARCLRAQQ